jgi:hypothetical protein|nr:MAG TPA: hypothetical protein [Caudoviricetes sp.]
MIIKFQLIKSLIIEAAEETTYLKGQIDKHTMQNASQAFVASETAGEEALSKRIFEHDFHTALELLKTIFIEHLAVSAQTIGDNAIYYNDKTDDIVEFNLEVSRRYNGTLTDTLARLCSKYVEDYIIQQWWLKTTNQKQSEPYVSMLQEDVLNIRKCFVLSRPLVPKVPYSSTLTAKVDGSEEDGAVTIRIDDMEVTLSYSIDEGTIDDIEAKSSDPSILEVHRSQEPHAFWLKPINTGVAVITLFSRHSDKLEVEVEATVAKEV